MNEQKRIIMPQAIHSDKKGFSELFKTLSPFLDPSNRENELILDFYKNTWFDANLLPALYAFVDYGRRLYGINCIYHNQFNDKLHKLLIRNNFAKMCFDLPYQPLPKETVYSGSVVKTKIRVFYNELIRLISYKEQGEDIGALP